MLYKMEALNAKLFEALNGERIWTDPDKVHESMYGNYKVTEKLEWKAKYVDIDTAIFKGLKFKHEDPKESTSFHMTYDVFEPVKKNRNSRIATLIVINGVPVNRREWYGVARLLSRFVRVVTIDLFGMGDSSKPLEFKDKKGTWLWSWGLHANIFALMLKDFRKLHPEWFINGKVFFGANDWGSGVLQKFVELYGDEYLWGASINSAIALDGYWVQHIGSLQALAMLPYPSPTFTVESVRFIGTFTALIETMFHRTSHIHNQYTMALLQDPYVEISYSDVKKNPANTEYKAHAVRVLAEQASVVLGNGELLPYHPKLNKNGLMFTNWNVPILMIWGLRDVMMPVGQIHRFSEMVAAINDSRKKNNMESNLWIVTKPLENAGHFAVSDQPERSAEAIFEWMRGIVGGDRVATAFLGFDYLSRQDVPNYIRSFNNMY